MQRRKTVQSIALCRVYHPAQFWHVCVVTLAAEMGGHIMLRLLCFFYFYIFKCIPGKINAEIKILQIYTYAAGLSWPDFSYRQLEWL